MKGIQTKGAREKGKGQIDLYLGAGAGQNTCGRQELRAKLHGWSCCIEVGIPPKNGLSFRRLVRTS